MLSSVLARLPEAVLILDRDWRIVFANEEARRVSRLQPEDLNSKTHWELFPDTLGTPVEQLYRSCMDSGTSGQIEYFYSPFNTWVDVTVLPIPAGIALHYRDNTARKQTEALFREQRDLISFVQQAARMMLDHEHVNRVILVVSSIRSEGARPGVSAYAASKAGVNQLARVAAYELAPHGVRVNVLSPGMTVTPLVLINTPEVHEKAKALVPMGRPGLPEDMAAAAAYFCSSAAGFVTGANLVVDGGEGLW